MIFKYKQLINHLQTYIFYKLHNLLKQQLKFSVENSGWERDFVCLLKTVSSFSTAEYGVPQGSVLGPIL